MHFGNKEILEKLNNLNTQLTLMQREVVGAITIARQLVQQEETDLLAPYPALRKFVMVQFDEGKSVEEVQRTISEILNDVASITIAKPEVTYVTEPDKVRPTQDSEVPRSTSTHDLAMQHISFQVEQEALLMQDPEYVQYVKLADLGYAGTFEEFKQDERWNGSSASYRGEVIVPEQPVSTRSHDLELLSRTQPLNESPDPEVRALKLESKLPSPIAPIPDTHPDLANDFDHPNPTHSTLTGTPLIEPPPATVYHTLHVADKSEGSDATQAMANPAKSALEFATDGLVGGLALKVPSKADTGAAVNLAPTQAPTPVSEKGPTLEDSATGGTVVVNDALLVETRRNFVGNGSIFARFLSPTIISGGKGFLKPKVAGLEQYSEDIRDPDLDILKSWPTGFYRSKDTKHVQFFVNTPRGLIYTETLPSNIGEVTFIDIRQTPMTKKKIGDMDISELLRFKEIIEPALLELTRQAQ